MPLFPKQLLRTLLHPRPLNALPPIVETKGLEVEQQRHRSRNLRMLSSFFETTGLELEQQTSRSQSLRKDCLPSQLHTQPLATKAPFAAWKMCHFRTCQPHSLPHSFLTPSSCSATHARGCSVTASRVQTRCALRRAVCVGHKGCKNDDAEIQFKRQNNFL
jgi:hypothetical protein